MKKNVVVTLKVYYRKLKMHRRLPLFRVSTTTTYTRPLQHYSGEEAEMECGKQKRASLITILSLTNPHDMTSPKYVTPMVTHDCFGEDCPCQHLIPNNYRLCEFHEKYACMKHIGDEWFFFAAHCAAFVINWRDAKWYNTCEEAMAFIHLHTTREHDL